MSFHAPKLSSLLAVIVLFAYSASALYGDTSVSTNVGVNSSSDSSYIMGDTSLVISGEDNAQEMEDSDGFNTFVDLNVVSSQKDVLIVKLSDGREAIVKVKPAEASMRAQAELEVDDCKTSCEMHLTEARVNGEQHAAYRVMTKKRAHVLGFIPATMVVTSNIDAETGTVIATEKPWWSFMASTDSAVSVETTSG